MEHSEIQDLKNDLSGLRSDVGAVKDTLTEIKVTLAKMEGQNLSARVFNLENKHVEMEKWQAERKSMPESIFSLEQDVTSLNAFRWKLVGVLIVLQVLFTGAATFLLKMLYASGSTQ